MDLFDGPDDFLGEDDAPDTVPADLKEVVGALNSDDPATVIGAITAVREGGLAQLQDRVAAAMERLGGALGDDGIDAALDCLDELGDGRCVRPMEAFLHAHGAGLSGNRAWRARHIVQRIRRFGRK